MSRSSLKTAKTVFFLLLFYTLYTLISGKLENHVTVLILTALISFFAVFLAGGYIAHSLARAKADDIIRSLSFFAFLIIIVCAPVTALSYALSLPIAMLLPRKVRENDSYTEEELTDIIEKAEDEGIIEEEEREIFTLMERGGERDANFALFDMPHADIDDRSNDIASLIVKSLPESAPTALRCDMLKDVYELRDDLRRHSNIETYLLRPLVVKYLKQR
jgi:hypothetical protein